MYRLRNLYTASLTLLLASGRLRAQSTWTEPNMVRWPLLEVATVHSPSTLELLVGLSPVTKQSRDREPPLLSFAIDTLRLGPWIVRTRHILDSLAALPRDIHMPSLAIRLPITGKQADLRVGYDANGPALPGRFFLAYRDSTPEGSWTAYAPDSAVSALFASLALPAAPPSPQQVPGTDADFATSCATWQEPSPRTRPKLHFPDGYATGGRVVLEFVIDTNGRPRAQPVTVLLSTGPKYITEVKRVFPELAYFPAKCDGSPVPVLSRQAFLFTWR